MKNQALLPTLRLSLEVTNVLADIERNGIKINRTTLADIRKQYEDEGNNWDDWLAANAARPPRDPFTDCVHHAAA